LVYGCNKYGSLGIGHEKETFEVQYGPKFNFLIKDIILTFGTSYFILENDEIYYSGRSFLLSKNETRPVKFPFFTGEKIKIFPDRNDGFCIIQLGKTISTH
jgi:hypothetical protein